MVVSYFDDRFRDVTDGIRTLTPEEAQADVEEAEVTTKVVKAPEALEATSTEGVQTA